MSEGEKTLIRWGDLERVWRAELSVRRIPFNTSGWLHGFCDQLVAEIASGRIAAFAQGPGLAAAMDWRNDPPLAEDLWLRAGEVMDLARRVDAAELAPLGCGEAIVLPTEKAETLRPAIDRLANRRRAEGDFTCCNGADVPPAEKLVSPAEFERRLESIFLGASRDARLQAFLHGFNQAAQRGEVAVAGQALPGGPQPWQGLLLRRWRCGPLASGLVAGRDILEAADKAGLGQSPKGLSRLFNRDRAGAIRQAIASCTHHGPRP